MSDSSEPRIWGLATASAIGSIFREAEITVTCQDAELRYMAAVNPLVTPPDGAVLIGLSDDDLPVNGFGRNLTLSKRRVVDSGQAESLDLRYHAGDRDRWYRIRLEPLANGDGRGILAASVDITGQKMAEEHLRLALLELAHRSKNLLAVVLSLARQSVEESENLADFRARFLGRVRSLAVAHDILTEEAWRGATVFSLLRSQLLAFGENAPEQSRIEGHNAFLKPNAVQYVGLALHELTALSVHSGALSRPDGTIAFTSRLMPAATGEGQMLSLIWKETGSAGLVDAGASRFGQALLKTIVPAALGGSAELEATGDGFVYELRIPPAQFF